MIKYTKYKKPYQKKKTVLYDSTIKLENTAVAVATGSA
jgi:hypothetical protein